MGLIIDPKLKQETDRLVANFNPVFQLWRSKQSDAALPPTAQDCLATDILKIGCYLLAADQVNRDMETKFLAEIIASIKTELDHMPYEYELATIDGALSEQLKVCGLGMPQLLTLQIAQSWVSDHHGNKSAAQDMVKSLAGLAGRIVTRDGRFGNEEMKRLKALEDYLQIA